MKKLLLSLIGGLLFLSVSRAQELPLLPYPQRVDRLSEQFRVDSSLYLHISDKIDSNLKHYVYWAGGRMSAKSNNMMVIDLHKDSTYHRKGIWIFFDSLQTPCVKANEGYRIDVNKKIIKVCASTSLGVMRALETLTQLLAKDETGYYFPGVVIEDKPQYNWRGLLIDVSRHFIPLKVLYRNIDAMAMAKMNVLHLHLTDDQGFRIESKKFPELHLNGSNGQYYTQADMRRLVEYASDRGVRVVPEFDLPGHATAWFAGLPEYASAQRTYQPESGYGVFDAAMDPTNEKMYVFLKDFFMEMATVFKDSCVHIGGDEVTGKDWESNGYIQQFMQDKKLKNQHELQAKFNQRLEVLLASCGKQMIGWDEVLDCHPSATTIIQSWRGDRQMDKAIAEGYQVVRSNGYYLDQTYTAGEYYVRRNTKQETDKGRIIGQEAAMWSELADSITIDSRLWPNTAAIAEIGWNSSLPVDTFAFYRRLETFSARLDKAGIQHERYLHAFADSMHLGRDVDEFVWLMAYLKPASGYKRHYAKKKKGTYATSFALNDIADMARPTSLAYIHLINLIEAYKKNPAGETKAELNDLFHEWMHQYEVLQRHVHKDNSIAHCMEASSVLAGAGRLGLMLLRNEPAAKEKNLAALKALEEKIAKQDEYTVSVLAVLQQWAESK
ncbi:MAG: beta-N-acetylhexosaminidase [Chitinophagaceae bacterium]|nr:beta-N-acetylhexosaminidase [Chitinophagaceae bacterium]